MTDQSNVPATISERALANTSGAPLPVNGDPAGMLAKLGAKVVKQVTRTVLQQIEDVPVAVEFETAAFKSEVSAPARGGAQKMQPARVADVINLVTGAKQLLIMNTVLEGELDRNYPNGGYKGRQFMIRSHFPNDGVGADGVQRKRKYRVFEIIEIEIERGESGLPENVEVGAVVADGTDPVNRKGGKPKG